MERYVVLLLFASAAGELQSPQSSKKYREDYTYSERTKAFYKLHADSAQLARAVRACEAEGAALLVPQSIQDLAEAHALMKNFPDLDQYIWLGDDGEKHESAEEEPMIKYTSSESQTEFEPENFVVSKNTVCPVLDREGQIRNINCRGYVKPEWPFVCKVELANAHFDARCDVYANDYVYKESVGSCYKISKSAYTWNQAYTECQQEGAHLVVLNSKAESLVVKEIMSAAPLLRDSYGPYYYIAGIRADNDPRNNPRVFRTIFNETLEAAGFAEWADTEPNNLGNNEYCGSLYESDGKYNDHNCVKPYGYICEKEIHPPIK